MFHTLLQWDILQKIVLNTLFVSIPEELFLVMFTLILLGEFDYWKEDECKKLINSWDYSRILIPTLTFAILSNIFRYCGLNFTFMSLIPLAMCYILIILTNDIFEDASALRWMGKTFIFMILGYMIIGISEFIYVPLVLYSTGKTIEEINQNLLLNFLVSLPSRIIQYSILLYFITKRRTLLKGNIFKHIVSSPFLTVFTFVITVFDFLFLFIAYKTIIYEEILIHMLLVSQILIIITVTIFPVLNISGLIWCVYYVENRAVQKQKQIFEKLSNLFNEIKLYTNNEDYDNIKWKLNEIGMGIEEIATNLYINVEKER